MSMLVRREVILAKIESTYNVDPTPAAANDAILVEEPNWAHEGARMVDRPARRQTHAPLQQVFAGTLRQITFTVELKGPGTAYAASNRPEIDVLLRACGFAATVDATPGSETVTYDPASTGHESITVYYYQDGTVQKLTGVRGNVSFALETGGIVKASFTLTGHSAGPTDVALPTPTHDATVPPVFIGASFAVHGYAAVINALNFDRANQVIMPPDANASDGYGEIQIVGRDFNGSFDPEHTLVATHDWEGKWRSGATGTLVTGTIGATQYNRFAIDFAKVYYRSVAPGDRDGIRTLEMGFAALEDSGDDEVSIVFS